jgi:tetratricopeptide (TPR) repeat protein
LSGGFTLEMAEQVCNPEEEIDILEGIAALLDNSLLRYETATRFGMFETIQEYALERLDEKGEQERFRRNHALAFARLAAEAGPELYSGRGEYWLDRLEADFDNIRQALVSLQGFPDLQPVGWELISNIVWLCYRRGYLNEARLWFERAVEQSKDLGDNPFRGALLSHAGGIAMWMSDLDTAVALLDEGLGILRRTEDASHLGFVLFVRGVLAVNRSESEDALRFLQEALPLLENTGSRWFLAMSYLHLGNVALGQGAVSRAVTHMEAALVLGREIDARWIVASALNNLGEIARYQKDYQQAAQHYLESKELFESVDSPPDVARAYHSLAYVALAGNDQAEACRLFEKSLELHQKLGVKRGVVEAVNGLAVILFERGQIELFVRLCGAVSSQFHSLGGALWPADRAEVEPRLASARQQLGEAVFSRALDSGEKIGLEEAIALAASA